MFLDILKQNKGQIELKISSDECYYECPIDFYKKAIKLYSESPEIQNTNLAEFNKIMLDKVRNIYSKYLNQLTENSKTLTNALKIIKKDIINNFEWGTININFRYFNKIDYINDLNIAVSHEFQHLMDYLINLNYENWNYCKYYSNSPHNSFSRNLPYLNQNQKNFEQINYFLDSNEFKSLKSTYCQYLRNCFIKNTEILTKENINDFITALYFLCEFKFLNNIKITKNIHKYEKIISNMRDFKDIKIFFQITYEDSLLKKHQFNTINKWEDLNNTLKHELENQLI